MLARREPQAARHGEQEPVADTGAVGVDEGAEAVEVERADAHAGDAARERPPEPVVGRRCAGQAGEPFAHGARGRPEPVGVVLDDDHDVRCLAVGRMHEPGDDPHPEDDPVGAHDAQVHALGVGLAAQKPRVALEGLGQVVGVDEVGERAGFDQDVAEVEERGELGVGGEHAPVEGHDGHADGGVVGHGGPEVGVRRARVRRRPAVGGVGQPGDEPGHELVEGRLQPLGALDPGHAEHGGRLVAQEGQADGEHVRRGRRTGPPR